MPGFSPAFQFYPGDWLSSPHVTLMTPEQEGAYIRLLCYAWADPDCSIPDDDEILAKLSRLGEGWFKGGSSVVRKCFEPHPEIAGKLVNLRLLKERKKQEIWREKSRSGGIKSAESRAKKKMKGGSKMVDVCLQPNGNSSSSSSINTSTKVEVLDKPAEEVFEYWKTIHGHPRAILDAKRRRLINDRLKEGFTVESLKLAIDGCKASAWHQGENDRHQVFDDISLICRDAGKVEQFIGYQSEKARAETERKPERCPECLGAGKVPVRGLLNRAADGSRMEPCPACQKKVEVSDVGTGTLRLATA